MTITPLPAWAQNEFIPDLSGSGTIDTPANGSTTVGTNAAGESFSSSFSGTININPTNSALFKAGSGTFTIDGATIQGGQFHVLDGAVAQTSGNTNVTFLSVGSGIASLPVSALNVSGGTISFGTTLQVGDFGGTGTVNQSGGIVMFGGQGTPVSLNIGNQSGTGTYNLSGGTLSFDGTGTTSFVTIGRNGASTSVNAQNPSTGVLNLSGNGQMRLTDATLFIGSNGFATSGAAGSGTINQTGGTLTIDSGSRLFLAAAGNGTYNLDGGTLQIGGTSLSGDFNNLGGTYTFNLGGGTIQVIGSPLIGTVNPTLVAGTTSTIDTNGIGATWSGVLSGGGALAKAGAGTLTLSGPNTYTGATTVAAGTLAAGAVNTLPGLTAVTVESPGILDLAGFNQSIGSLAGAGSVTLGSARLTTGNDNTSTTFSGVMSGTGALDKVGTGTFVLAGDNSYTGGTTISAGTLQLGNGGISGSIVGDVADNGSLAFDRSDTVSFPGIISGTGGVTQAGTGTLTLLGNNTYSGGTNLNAGTVAIGADAALGAPNGPLTFNGGTLQFGSSFDLAATRPVTLNAAGGTIDTNSHSTTISQSIGGSGGLTKAGVGMLILTGTSTYSGPTTISGGTLAAGIAHALPGLTAVTIGSSGTLDLRGFNQSIGSLAGAGNVSLGTAELTTGNNNTSTEFSGVMSGPGSLVKAGTGTMILSGANTFTGGTTILGGALEIGDGGTGGGIFNVVDDGTLDFDRSDTFSFPGVISGGGGLVQLGTGTTILIADNPFTGPTTVSAGTLAIGDAAHSSAALSGGGPVSVAAGATLGGYGSVAGNVTNDGTLAAGNAVPAFHGDPAGTFTLGGDLLNRATVNLASDPIIGNTLVIHGNYTASGTAATLIVNTLLNTGGPLSNQVTDRLLVFGNANGSTMVRVNGSSAGAVTSTSIPDAADGISLIQVGGASSPGAFALAGGSQDFGTPFEYHLNAYGPGSPNGLADPSQSLVGNPGNHWDYRLQNAEETPAGPAPPGALPPDARPEVAPQVPAYITAPTALFNAGFQDLDSLHRRLGEIRDDQTQGRGQQGEVFVRAYGSRFNYTSDRSFTDFGFNSSQDYAATQFGGNWIALDNADGTLRAGLAGMIGQLWFQPSAVDGASKGFFNTQTLAGTVTWQSRAGWYVDGIVAGGMFDGRFTTPTRGQTTGMNGTSVAASVEAGYPIPLGWQGVAIEPQVQLVYQHLDFARRTDVDGINVDLGSPDQGVFRGGARLTKQFAGSDGMLFTPYLKANVLTGIGGGDAVHLSNVSFDTGHFGTALQVGGGITGTLTRNLSVYGDVAWQHEVGGGGSRGWAFNGGLRYAFGAAPAAIAGIQTAAPAPAAARTYLVFFDWDKATLTDRARQIIAEAAAASHRVQLTRIEVNGYTDTSGTPRYNQGLSVRRAQAVAAELVRDGVPRGAIAIQGFGETHLLVPTGPGVREPQNRRVEIIIR